MISDSTEAIHPGLDAILRARFDDPATVAVYADWLEEREDPRGTLMRMQSQPTVEGEPDCEAFIGRHWERWLGDVLPAPTSDRSSTLTWRSGFVRAALFYEALEVPLSRLWSRPAMRFLDQLRLVESAGPSAFADLEQLPCLRVLQAERLDAGALVPLVGQGLRALESLEIELSEDPAEDDLRALHAVELPALHTLNCDLRLVGAQTVRRLVPLISLRPLKVMRLVLETEAVLTELLPLIESHHAREITLSMPPSLASAWRNRLRALNPAVQLRLQLPRGHGSNEVLTSAASCFVPVERAEEDDNESTVVWSTETWSDVGRPLLEVDPDGIQVCGACAGTAVRCHYRRVRTPRNDCIGEIDVEMQCDECGQFSRYKRLWHAGFPVVDDRNEWYWDDMADELAAVREEERLKEGSGAAEEVHVNQPVEDEDAPF